MRYGLQPGDRVIWLRSPGRSFLTGWKVAHVPAIVVRVCSCRIRIRVFLDAREKTVNVDPDNLIYVRPFPNVNAGRWQISTEGGTRPVWNRNGRELFYYLAPGTMMAVPVEIGESFKAGSPTVLFKGEYRSPQDGLQYSVTADGRRFLMMKDAAAKEGDSAPAQRINVVLNWTEELKQRVPVK